MLFSIINKCMQTINITILKPYIDDEEKRVKVIHTGVRMPPYLQQKYKIGDISEILVCINQSYYSIDFAWMLIGDIDCGIFTIELIEVETDVYNLIVYSKNKIKTI